MSNSAFRPGSEEEWEALMRQLRQQPKPEPQPFFYARVRARLVAKTSPTTALLPGWLRRPAYVAVLSALVLAMSGDGIAAAPPSPSSGSPVPQVAP